jgi:hypothetical protein
MQMSINVLGNVVIQQPKFIKFYPSLRLSIQSDKAILITEILENWFKKDAYKAKGFYKFLEPCDHYLYKKGDSWIEELGCVRISFNRAFDQIGIRYKSKSAYLKESDKFKGKMYASYYDRISKKTFYIRNNEVADELFKSMKSSNSKSIGEGDKNKSNSQNIAQKNYPKCSLPSEQNVRYERGIIGGYIYNKPKAIDYNKSNSLGKEQDLKKNDSKLSSLDKKTALSMIEIWKKEIGDTYLTFCSATVLQMLHACLEEKFEGSLFKWQEYCQIINSSKFFMGEGFAISFKKPYLLWALKEATIEKIFTGEYSIGDRETNLDHELALVKAEMQTVSAQKSYLEGNKLSLKSDMESKRLSEAREQVNQLTPEELETLRLKFTEDLRSRGERFANMDADNDACKKILEIMFDGYLIKSMQSKIFSSPLEEDQLFIEKSKEYELQLNEAENKISMLKVTFRALHEKKQQLTIKSQFEQEKDRERSNTLSRLRN